MISESGNRIPLKEIKNNHDERRLIRGRAFEENADLEKLYERKHFGCIVSSQLKMKGVDNNVFEIDD